MRIRWSLDKRYSSPAAPQCTALRPLSRALSTHMRCARAHAHYRLVSASLASSSREVNKRKRKRVVCSRPAKENNSYKCPQHCHQRTNFVFRLLMMKTALKLFMKRIYENRRWRLLFFNLFLPTFHS